MDRQISDQRHRIELRSNLRRYSVLWKTTNYQWKKMNLHSPNGSFLRLLGRLDRCSSIHVIRARIFVEAN